MSLEKNELAALRKVINENLRVQRGGVDLPTHRPTPPILSNAPDSASRGSGTHPAKVLFEHLEHHFDPPATLEVSEDLASIPGHLAGSDGAPFRR